MLVQQKLCGFSSKIMRGPLLASCHRRIRMPEYVCRIAFVIQLSAICAWRMGSDTGIGVWIKPQNLSVSLVPLAPPYDSIEQLQAEPVPDFHDNNVYDRVIERIGE